MYMPVSACICFHIGAVSSAYLPVCSIHYINTRFFSKITTFFSKITTFFSKPNSALFDRSQSSRRQSDAMCLSRRDRLFAPTIRYQFKRRLFSRRPCTGPHLWAGPHSRLQRFANCVSISFNLLVTNQRCLADLRRRSLLMGTLVCTPI
jgi:hypothetical protein